MPDPTCGICVAALTRGGTTSHCLREKKGSSLYYFENYRSLYAWSKRSCLFIVEEGCGLGPISSLSALLLLTHVPIITGLYFHSTVDLTLLSSAAQTRTNPHMFNS